jgi:hypothetical protein
MKFTNKEAISINEGVFSSTFHPNFFLSFDPSFCTMELNTMQNFWQKDIHSPLWILASRGQKKLKSYHPLHEKFGILD